MISRRGLLLGLASALAAPAIVHAGNLMPVKSVPIFDPDAVEWIPSQWKVVEVDGSSRIFKITYKIIPVDASDWQSALTSQHKD